jgi:hypothetical protein
VLGVPDLMSGRFAISSALHLAQVTRGLALLRVGLSSIQRRPGFSIAAPRAPCAGERHFSGCERAIAITSTASGKRGEQPQRLEVDDGRRQSGLASFLADALDERGDVSLDHAGTSWRENRSVGSTLTAAASRTSSDGGGTALPFSYASMVCGLG